MEAHTYMGLGKEHISITYRHNNTFGESITVGANCSSFLKAEPICCRGQNWLFKYVKTHEPGYEYESLSECCI